MRPREATALGALASILAITVCWWALALWPLPDATPAWLLRTRAICFGTAASGLPDLAGWMALIGQPALMLGTLLLVWGDAVAAGWRALARCRAGRLALRGVAVFLLTATGAAVVRVASAAGSPQTTRTAAAPPLPDYPRLERPAPALDLVDQRGERISLARFRGRPVLLTFAYAHCETVCPLVVQDVLRARDLLRDRSPVLPVVLVVTLDPWRDTPSRLPAIAQRWKLEGDAFVASGDTAAVTATLARWNIPMQRDLRTGEIGHPAVVFVIDGRGRIAYTMSGGGGTAAIVDLVRRL